MTFSLLVGLKNNLAYSQHFYTRTRSLYPDLEIIFVSFGSTDGTHQWLDSLQDQYVRQYYAPDERTLSDAYNKAIELATSQYVVFAHNDMVLAPGFVEELALLQTPERVIFYTTVEPPIFADDERPGKLVADFGADVQSFQYVSFVQFAEEQRKHNNSLAKVALHANRTSFFLSASRQALLAINGLDSLFAPMFCEDDDLIVRLKLSGFEILVSVNALCYHFVSKTSRFSPEYALKTRQIEQESNRNFVRKWGFSNASAVQKKYDMGLILTRGNAEIIAAVEPWFTTIYTDVDVQSYLHEEQPKTKFDLTAKFRPRQARKTNGILIELIHRKADESWVDSVPFLHEAIYHRLTKRRSWLGRIWYRLLPSFRWKQYRIRILDATTHEHELIRQTQNTYQLSASTADTPFLRDNRVLRSQ